MEEGILGPLQESIFSLMLAGQLKACYKLCIDKPGKDLSAGEKQCLAMCQDRYQDVFEKTFFRQFESFAKSVEDAKNHPNS